MIKANIQKILSEIPEHIQVVAAAKTRTLEEVREAVEAGITIIGENYVQEALPIFEALGLRIKYHFIGHLQTNKVKKAVEIFDMIETVDSIKLAREIDKRCQAISKIMDILIEVNSGHEIQKYGVFPEQVEDLLKKIAPMKNITVQGLMTMGPYTSDPEIARPYFMETKKCFNHIKALGLPNIEMRYLSMGMTGSYQVAIEEGANLIRIGTKIFGPRH